MPAQRLSDKPIQVERFDVLGEDSTSVARFVCHLGLAIETPSRVVCGERLEVRHMRPPLENPGWMRVDCCGSATLTVDEANQVQLTLDEIELEYAAVPQRPNQREQFVVHPHVKPWLAKDGTVQWLRFSCVGLVIMSYEEANIKLVDEESLEPVDANRLDAAYPDLAPIRELSSRLREHLGIPGEGPWPVMLPGYVLHALDRDAEAIRQLPHKPAATQSVFP